MCASRIMEKPQTFPLVLCSIFAGAALADCHASNDAHCAGNACPGKGDPPPAQLDDCHNATDAPGCLDDALAFFVSGAKGDDGAGDGTKAKPFKTLTTALGKITDAKRRIYICEGTYDEDIVLEAKHAGVSLFGGLSCDWHKSAARPTFGKSTPALTVADARGVTIASLAFSARDAAKAGGSSVAAFLRNADVTFKGVSLKAGKGMKGTTGNLIPFTYPDVSLLKGNDGDDATNGGSKPYTCPGGALTVGGRGGRDDEPDGIGGTPGATDNESSFTDCKASHADAKNGEAGVNARTPSTVAALGRLLDTGWEPSAGRDGTGGGPGQGGGGGGGDEAGGIGGGGGAGGCGGAGGEGGGGGGASIAVASLNATASFVSSDLSVDSAGDGGDGAPGQTGQPAGGAKGKGSRAACNGGEGGPGGNGAPGGGGAGGISVGVVYKGTRPVLDDATTNSIAPKDAGKPGEGPGSPGLEGLSTVQLETS
jgi:hypothetical protein